MTKSFNRILFVDDDRIQHMINKKNLLRLKPDLELFFFENPFLALEWMDNNEADLLLLDVNMPEMSGWEFLDELVRKNNQIDVKMLTSSMDPDDIQKSAEYMQITGFLVKPLQGKAIEEFLGEWT
jgi:two-component system, response regulator PdtaR